jgi:hypothetical protein
MTFPVISVPTYTMKLPYSNKEVKYRPYLVKEEKLLIMANEGEDQDHLLKTVGDIVHACTFGAININTDPMFDVQYAFLNIRGKSQGETVEFFSICSGCEKRHPSSIHVEQFKLVQNPTHSSTIDLGNGMKIEMKYPTFYHFLDLFHDDSATHIYRIVAQCINKVYTEDEVFTTDTATEQEMLDFVESMTPEQFELLEKFFATMPILQYSTKFVCACGKQNLVVIDGVKNFFG